MPVDIVVDTDYAVLSYSGVVTVAGVAAVRDRILEVIQQNNMSKLCVDLRSAEQILSGNDLRATMENNAEVVPPRPHTAVLGRADQQTELKFIEDFAVARGMPIRAFVDEEAALSWLRE